MKTILVDAKIFCLASPDSAGLISGLKLLQSKECKLYIDGLPKTLNPLILKILKSENITLNPKVKNITFNYIIALKAKNLLVNNETKLKTFQDVSEFIVSGLRFAHVVRETKETDISVVVSLDSKLEGEINTGIGFFDHMLSQIARHGNIYLRINVNGDLHVDEHHTVEDTGLALGNAIAESLGNKKGIKRYGFFLPMDDSAAYCGLDLGGRAFLNFNAEFKRTAVGGFPTELTEEFFRALSTGMKANIYLKTKGKNDHHKIESLFKAFAKALNEACRIDGRALGTLPSTKGLL
ncbi:MAG: imidazoleglycerol-phosphate dehydratase HisB [Ignavibacteriaceae bacterium]|nr:imidazoleglycerol-phosphate dehydratase HisB [Ignavibacteriaceae bacterium]